MDTSEFDHGSWYAIGSVGIGYGILCAIIFAAFFVVPYLVFATL
ncbi:MAG: hypothetical protein ACQETB_03390 [Halobacteriota archaeon]